MNKVDDEVIINDICDYAKKHKVKELLQEYLRRIIVDQPEDPVPYSPDLLLQKPDKKPDFYYNYFHSLLSLLKPFESRLSFLELWLKRKSNIRKYADFFFSMKVQLRSFQSPLLLDVNFMYYIAE